MTDVPARSAVRASEDAFTRFYLENWSDLVAYCSGLLSDRAAGEEAAQDAFVRIYPRWSRLDDARPYVFRVAGNLCSRQRRLRARVVAHGLDPGDLTASTSPDEMQRLVVERALGRLPLRLRHVLLLHYYAGMPVAEVADVLRRPVGTVKRQLHDAREALALDLSDPRIEGADDGSA